MGSGIGLGIDLEDGDMISSAQTDVELMLAANVGLEHIETYISNVALTCLRLPERVVAARWTETDLGERRRAVGELLARRTH